MDSFALAYEKDSDEECDDFYVKVNINLWIQCESKEKTPVLDLGFMLYNITNVKKIRIYFPFLVSETQITDLCGILSKDNDLLGAVFNEPYSLKTIPDNPKKVLVNRVGNGNNESNVDTPFVLYSIDPRNDIIFEEFNGREAGTFADIDISSIKGNVSAGNNEDDKEASNYYLRLRVQSPDLADIVREYKSPNRFFDTLVNSTYMVDLRFNNTRSMDHTLVEELTSRNCFRLAPISSLHMLLMTKVYVDVDKSPFCSSRVIEKNIWNNYVEKIFGGKEMLDVIAYHAKSVANDGKNIGSWEFFTRMKVGKIITRTLLFYFSFLAFFTITCNLLTNLVAGFELWMFVVFFVITIGCFIFVINKNK